MSFIQFNPDPHRFADRALVAMSGVLEATFAWDRMHTPFSARLPSMGLLLAAGDEEHPLDLRKLLPMSLEHSTDVLATYVDRYRPAHVMHFDVVLHADGGQRLHEAYRLWLARDHAAHFIPEGTGPCILANRDGLVEAARPPFANDLDRTLGMARGQAALYSGIWQRTAYAANPEREFDVVGRPLDHPNRLAILFPMHGARECRRVLVGIDDALHVQRDRSGDFRLDLRPMRKLTRRGHAPLLRELAAELESGCTLIVVDRDCFLEELTRLALEHAPAPDRALTEQAASIVAERRDTQIWRHDDTNDPESRMGRSLIASRERRTRARPGEQNGPFCRYGVPTPRSEQLWNCVRGDLCDVRTDQRGRVAWEKWTRSNRPDMIGGHGALKPSRDKGGRAASSSN